MRFNTIIYCLKQGIKNIFRNKLFSLYDGSMYFSVWIVLCHCDECTVYGERGGISPLCDSVF